MRVLALAGYDSFLNTANLLAPYFQRENCDLEYALVQARTKKQISTNQVRSLALGAPLTRTTIEDLCDSGEIAKFDIVLACLEGLSTRRLVHHLGQFGSNRPLLISVYPGLVLRFPYDGYSTRSSSDLLWLNCQADHDAFVKMCDAFKIDASGARVFGIAPLLQPIKREPSSDTGPIVFFEQAIIPRYYDERLFLASQLVSIAKRHPQFELVVKPRSTGKDATLHRTWHPFVPLLKQAAEQDGGWPTNLRLSTEKASTLLEKASHCLTVNSTVATEAINAGVPTIIIGDFGAHDEYGLSYFFGSGLIRPFADITFPCAIKPNPDWQARYMTDPHKTLPNLVKEAIDLTSLDRQSLASRTLDAEMSPELRGFLAGRIGMNSLLSRSYQKRPKRFTVKAFKALFPRWLAGSR